MKRGFKTEEEALTWEKDFKEFCKKDMSKSFGEFYKNYESDIRPRVRPSTWRTKEYIVKYKILPYFKDMPMNSIKPLDILKWQNKLLVIQNKDGNGLSGTYLKTIQAQLSDIFNHVTRFYDLPSNPVKTAGPIGVVQKNEMNYWTKEEYLRFIECMKDSDKYYYALELLYWCGLRVGEVLALTESDFDFTNNTDIRAINSYDIQQVMRYNLAYAKHPEGVYTVDFNKPLINGKLPVIECRCENAKGTFVETITCRSNHLQVLDDALMTFYNLHSVNIRELFEYYTDDEMALELAGLIEKLLSGIKPDEQFVEGIKKIWKKVICAGGVFCEEK